MPSIRGVCDALKQVRVSDAFKQVRVSDALKQVRGFVILLLSM